MCIILLGDDKVDNKLISKSFLWMFIGLLVTFITGYVICLNQQTLMFALSGFYIIAIIVQLVLVFVLSRNLFKLKPTTVKILFLIYSMVTGFTFASVFVVYEIASIIFVFALAAVLFGIMGLIGYYSNIDFSKFSSYLMFGLIGVIIASIINIFWINDTFTTIICIISILVFLGFTAYDIQKIKRLNIDSDNVAIYGALELYLDFINIFLDLLRLFARERD